MRVQGSVLTRHRDHHHHHHDHNLLPITFRHKTVRLPQATCHHAHSTTVPMTTYQKSDPGSNRSSVETQHDDRGSCAAANKTFWWWHMHSGCGWCGGSHTSIIQRVAQAPDSSPSKQGPCCPSTKACILIQTSQQLRMQLLSERPAEIFFLLTHPAAAGTARVCVTPNPVWTPTSPTAAAGNCPP